MEDWPGDEGSPRNAPQPTLRPVFVAGLIVVACVALAVYTLKNPYAPPPLPEEPVPEATASPTPVHKVTPIATAPPRATEAWVVPTLPPTAPPTAAIIATTAPTRTPIVVPTATPVPVPTVVPKESPSLRNVAPPRVKKGSTVLLDVRGKALRADLHAIILRGGKVPLEIAVPRQRFVNAGLVQVLIVVAPGAPKGEYDVSVADVEGRRSNSVKFEVTQ